MADLIQLQFRKPLVSTFLDYAFLFGIAPTNMAYDTFLLSSYGSLCVIRSFYKEVYDPIDLFPAPRLRQFTQVMLIEAETADFGCTIGHGQDTLEMFLEAKLADGHHCLVTLDEYFLPGKLATGRTHFIHNHLVVGIDRACRRIALAGYFMKQGWTFGIRWISLESFACAFACDPGLLKPNDGQEIFAVASLGCVTTIRVRPDANYPFDAARIWSSLGAYLRSTSNEDEAVLHNKDIGNFQMVFGISTYEEIITHLQDCAATGARVSPHELRIVSEHKALMLERYNVMSKKGLVTFEKEVYDSLFQCVAAAKRARVTAFLHARSDAQNWRNAVNSVCDDLAICRDIETSCYPKWRAAIKGGDLGS